MNSPRTSYEITRVQEEKVHEAERVCRERHGCCVILGVGAGRVSLGCG